LGGAATGGGAAGLGGAADGGGAAGGPAGASAGGGSEGLASELGFAARRAAILSSKEPLGFHAPRLLGAIASPATGGATRAPCAAAVVWSPDVSCPCAPP